MKRKLRVDKGEEMEKIQTQTKTNFFGAVAVIGNSAKPKAGPKDKIEMFVPHKNIQKLIDEVVQYKKEENEAKANKETAEVDVIDWGLKHYESNAFEGNFRKSFRMKGINEMVTFVTSDKFLKIDPNSIPSLREAFGKRFDEMFQKKTTISLNESVFSDPELQAELLTRIGKENFAKLFKKDEEFTTVDGFDRKLFTFPRKVVDVVKDLVKQAKPSLK